MEQEAAGNDEFEKVKHLCQEHPDMIHATGSEYEETPLLEAAFLGRTRICEYLLRVEADANATDRFKENPLIVASKNGHLGVVQVLVNHRPAPESPFKPANLEYRDRKNLTPLLHACEGGRPPLEDGATTSQINTIRFLINSGANCEAVGGPKLNCPPQGILERARESLMDNFAAITWLELFTSEFKWAWPPPAGLKGDSTSRYHCMSRASMMTLVLISKRYVINNSKTSVKSGLLPELWDEIFSILQASHPVAPVRYAEESMMNNEEFFEAMRIKSAKKHSVYPFLSPPSDLDSDADWEWTQRWNTPPRRAGHDTEENIRAGCELIKGKARGRQWAQRKGIIRGRLHASGASLVPGLANVEPEAFIEAIDGTGRNMNRDKTVNGNGYWDPELIAEELHLVTIANWKHGAPQAWPFYEAIQAANEGAGLCAMSLAAAAALSGFHLVGYAVRQCAMGFDSPVRGLTAEEKKFQLEVNSRTACDGGQAAIEAIKQIYAHAAEEYQYRRNMVDPALLDVARSIQATEQTQLEKLKSLLATIQNRIQVQDSSDASPLTADVLLDRSECTQQ